MKAWRAGLPFLISLGLLGWLLWTISPEQLAKAARQLNWSLLIPATLTMAVCLYFWDAVCLRALYSTRRSVPTYGTALRVLGLAYLAGAIHYELGQAAVAWRMSRLQQIRLLSALSLSLVLMYHDIVVLLSLGLWGSLATNVPELYPVLVFCSVGLVVMACVGTLPFVLTARRPELRRESRWAAWMDSWTWQRSAQLLGLRLVYFGILLVYAGVGLWICEVPVSAFDVVRTIPLVLLADGLPNISGLGTRDTSLQLLLQPEHPERLLAMSLLWSTGMFVVRLMIGLFHLWAGTVGLLKTEPAAEPDPGQPLD